MTGPTYRDAGVDIDAGERAVALMRDAVRATHGDSVVRGLSDFGGMYALGAMRDPVLVSSTDGVGTKLKLAFALSRHDSIGQDLVAMCVDDIICQGARPLFFLDYVATGKVLPETVAEIVGGIARACSLAGCALLGGETAELPGFYADGEYDLAGFAVGAVERSKLIDGSAVRSGDVVLALPSPGLRSNGYSLARKVLLEVAGLELSRFVPELGTTLGEELLRPSRIYCASLAQLVETGPTPNGIAHITGGGITGNLPRCIPEGLCARVRISDLPLPPIFGLIQRLGGVSDEEMYRTFNMGAGMLVVLAPQDAGSAMERLQAAGEQPVIVGDVVTGSSARTVLV